MCGEAMRSPLISTANSFSKPSIRKHSSSENLFADHHYYLHLQPQEKHSLVLPPSPSRKADSTLSTCVCFIFFFFIITIAAFLLCSNIDPPQIVEHSFSVTCCRSKGVVPSPHADKPLHAWKGLGTVFLRGTRAMSELVVAHIAENTRPEELRLFLRTSYRSGVLARADLVFLFDSNALLSSMLDVIYEENHSFHRLLRMSSKDGDQGQSIINASTPSSLQMSSSNTTISTLNINAYRKSSSENESSSQPFWGYHTTNCSQNCQSDAMMLFRWGSMVGFDTLELNADDTLAGFFDHPPVMLRRWPCYQMLLGMVRHRFKHVLLTDVSGVAMLQDPFALATRRKVGLYLSLEDRTWGASSAAILGVNVSTLHADYSESMSANRRDRVTLSSTNRAVLRRQNNGHLDVHQRGVGAKRRLRRGTGVGGLYERVYGKRMWSALEEFERRKKLVNSGVILGGIHQIRGLANVMVTEIVRVAMQRTNRDTFPDSVLLSYLLHKSSSVLGKRVLDHLHLLDNGESFVHSLVGSQQSSLFLKRNSRAGYAMIQGNHKSKRWGTAALVINSDICASPADAKVYIDCALQYRNKFS
ncbi:hypothetical protein GOP47_0001259 [Adiantum capillus-veneris]|uniref:DUF7780 domain-containing protein n=1 Tax=Adiantum capillus-veneris TaxID=13818 RepID=A0A9D4ZTV4_ADICA|nr:hypothetical protein GOP47_0001259 [Adiantum capillus-veneris]